MKLLIALCLVLLLAGPVTAQFSYPSWIYVTAGVWLNNPGDPAAFVTDYMARRHQGEMALWSALEELRQRDPIAFAQIMTRHGLAVELLPVR